MLLIFWGKGDTKMHIKTLNIKQPKFYIIMISFMILIVAVMGLLLNSKDKGPDLSLLNIDNFLATMATVDEITIETKEGKTLTISQNSNFYEVFEQEKWREKKVESPLESSATFKIILHDSYYIDLYEDYALIYNGATQEKYRYYTIPKDVYTNLESYVLANGEKNNTENPIIKDDKEIEGSTYI